MKTYCLMCKKSTDNVGSKMIRTKNGRLQLKSRCSIYGNKKSGFISENEANGSRILSSLGIKTPLSNIPGLNILF